jgi:hypothetical protein
MLTIVHNCRASHGRTLRSRAHAIKGRLMVSWVTSCVYTTLARSLGAMTPTLLPLVGPITLLLPTWHIEPLRGAVWSDFWVSFLIFFFQSFIPDAHDFANTWIWNCRDDSACRVRTCGTTWGVCSRRVICSSWVNPYQMDVFTHWTSTCRRSRGSKRAHFVMVQIRIWLKNNMWW